MHDSPPKLVYVFVLFEKIELNMIEERVVTVGFSMSSTASSNEQDKPQQSASDGEDRGDETQSQTSLGRIGASKFILSFSSQ